MGESHKIDRIEGKAEEIGGTIQKKVGHLLGNEKMERAGKAKELEGRIQQDVARAGERADDAADDAADRLKGRIAPKHTR